MRIKRIKNILDNFFDFFEKNRGKFIVSSLVFLIGLIIGAIFEIKNTSGDSYNYMNNFTSAYKLQGVSSAEIFLRALFSYFRLFLILWISGHSIYLVPLNYICLTAKGFGLGFTLIYFVNWNGLVGFVFGILTLFIQNIIFIPAFLIYSVYQLNLSVGLKRIRQNSALGKRFGRLIFSNIKTSVIIVLIILVCSCIEAYIIPSLIMPLCLNF